MGGLVSTLALGTMPVIVLVKQLKTRGELKWAGLLQTFPLGPRLNGVLKVNWVTCQQILGVVSP